MHMAESVLAGGMGLGGAALALWGPIAQLDPIAPGVRIAQLGVPGVLAVALVSVSWAFVWALKNNAAIINERVQELQEERKSYATALSENSRAMTDIRDSVAQNTAALVLMSSEHRTVMQRVERALDSIAAHMQATADVLREANKAAALCQEQTRRRTESAYKGPERRCG